MNKKIIITLLVIIWLILIFIFSNMNSDISNYQSKGLIYKVVDITSNISYELKITNNPLTEKEKIIITEKLNYPVRKIVHFTEYFILALLITNLFKIFKLDKKYFLIIITCLILSSIDEFHQLFINGRTGQIKDVIIDISGSITYTLIYYHKNKKKL